MPLNQICFMVMPYGIKPVVPAIPGAPVRINFDLLWRDAFEPAIRALGYDPVRADQETGALIIHEMLERLFYSDLIVADMTIPNGNVYYEIGIRHAAKSVGCVLLAADWAMPLFDTQQMRRVTYPLPEESVSAAAAQVIFQKVVEGVPALAGGLSPMNIVLPDYPKPDPARATTMRRVLEQQREFDSRLTAARLLPEGAEKQSVSRKLAAEFPAAASNNPASALAVATTLRDAGLWDEMRDYLQALPDRLRELPWVQQQSALALSKAKTSDHLTAVGALKSLIAKQGDSSESQGLMGGRFKKLAQGAKDSGDDQGYRRYLDQAIDAYEQGMHLDLGGYYPVSNLARLYRDRGDPGDGECAQFALRLTMESCEALRARGAGDEWLRPTLLGAAFDTRDYDAAERLTREIRKEGHAAWKLDTTIADLRRSVGQITDASERIRFEALVKRLGDLLPQ